MTDDERQELLDTEHLRLLRIGYLISGGANAVWACFPLIHITIGILMLSGVFPGPTRPGAPDTLMPGLFFVVIGVAFSSFFAISATLELLAARRLRERRSRTFCLVVAGLTCLGIPYGTALGIFTIIVLGRPSVAQRFH